jgi:Clostripain family
MSDIVGAKVEINSGNVADEEEFLAWAARNFPAKRYMYSVFNHGGGFNDKNENATYGIGFDDSSDDSLSHRELAQCVDYLNLKTGKKLSVFYPYACLMGGVELAYELRDKADCLLFSEESFPAETWSYEALGILNTNVNTTSLNLAKNFCDSAYAYFTTTRLRDFTLSVIDLSSGSINPLYSAIDLFATQAISYIGSDASRADVFNDIARSSFSMMADEYEDWYYVDLGNYMSAISGSASITSSDVQNAATAVKTALNGSVLYHKQNGYVASTGMSIFQNIHYGACYYNATTYKNILAFGSNKWVDYVSKIYSTSTSKPLYYDSYEPDNFGSTAKTISIGATQSRGMHSPMDDDLIKFTATAGMTYTVNLAWPSDLIDFAMIIDENYYYALTLMPGDMTFYCIRSGTYYVVVEGATNSSSTGGKGNYTVSLSGNYTKPGSAVESESPRMPIIRNTYGRIILKNEKVTKF